MLNGGMDLETDLGIDSIKKVEIFAAVRERAEGLPPTDSPRMAQLFEARTLDEVMRRATDDTRCRRSPRPSPQTTSPIPRRRAESPGGGAPNTG